jgi:hypothetical protein
MRPALLVLFLKTIKYMHVFPILESHSNEHDEEFAKVIGYQVLDSNGVLLAKGESPTEAKEAALVAMFLSESNGNTSKPLKQNRGLLSKR